MTKALAIGYILGSIYTFGAAWVLEEGRHPLGTYPSEEQAQLVRSLGCGAFWPFYWSVKMWRFAVSV